MLMDLMTRKADVVVEEDKDAHQEWEFCVLRVVFPSGVIGIELAECAVRDVPIKFHHAKYPNTKTSTILQQCHLESEKGGKGDDSERRSSIKGINDESLVAYISGLAPQCAASLMGFEVGKGA
jgi:hypothetical protein